MDIINLITNAPIHDDSKHIMLLRYVDKKTDREDVKDIIGIPERSFYRRRAEGMNYIKNNWQTETKKPCNDDIIV
jgi:hypothetical protein